MRPQASNDMQVVIHERVWTPREIAEAIGVTQKTVSRYILDDMLVAFKTPGGHWRVRDHVARQFLRCRGVFLND